MPLFLDGKPAPNSSNVLDRALRIFFASEDVRRVLLEGGERISELGTTVSAQLSDGAATVDPALTGV